MARKKRRAVDYLIDAAIVAIVLGLCIYAVPMILDNAAVETAAHPDEWREYKPDDGDTAAFDELRQDAPDAVAWLELYGTNIDYPVMYSSEHGFYMSKNPVGEFSISGSIFLDEGSSPDFSDRATLVYGHHMVHDLMFGSLDEFGEEGYFTEHQYGRLFYDGADHGLEVWLFLTADAYDKTVYKPGIKEPEQGAAYGAHLLEMAKLSRDVGFAADDRLLVMSTCAADGSSGRTLVVAKILDWVPEDPFADDGSPVDIAAVVEGAMDDAEGCCPLCPWCWVVLCLFLANTLCLTVLLISRIKKRITR